MWGSDTPTPGSSTMRPGALIGAPRSASTPTAPRPTQTWRAAALLVKNFIIASSTTMTRTALDLVGGFEAALRGTDDWDMWLRIAMAGMNACQVDPEPTTILRFQRHLAVQRPGHDGARQH